jgi:acyl-CoA thioester hydrolase
MVAAGCGYSSSRKNNLKKWNHDLEIFLKISNPGKVTMETLPTINQFPLKTREKLRYADTDRQGHVNNAVFATMLETGRLEILYDPEQHLASEDCAFVIVHLNLDFHAEIFWPGEVQIGTRIIKIGKSSISFKQALFQNERCVATANSVVVHANKSRKESEPLTKAAAAYLKSLQYA